MTKDELFHIVDIIMNKATPADFEVIKAAVNRRDKSQYKPMGADPAKMAGTMAQQIDNQLGMSSDMVRKMVRGYAAEIIRKNAPELEDGQVEELLGEWVGPSQGSGTRSRKSSGKKAGKSGIPPDAILAMVRQFIAYSTESMNPSEYRELEQSIPDWKERYWDSFPEEVQRVIALYLKGQISSDQCMSVIKGELFE